MLVEVEVDKVFAEFAAKKALSAQQLAQKIISTYIDCLHTLQCEDIEKCYIDFEKIHKKL